MEEILVVAPHPDDETLSCGGTLLRHKDSGGKIHWLIVTQMYENQGFSDKAISRRESVISLVREAYGFDSVSVWEIPTTMVDTVPMNDLVTKASKILAKLKPDTVFLPFCGDVHTDHYYSSKAFLSCCKWFRHPYLKYVLYYETISETDFNIDYVDSLFRPNVFIDVSDYFSKKMKILNYYVEELGEFPFPRSVEAIESLAMLRGSQCGAKRAEALHLLRGVIL